MYRATISKTLHTLLSAPPTQRATLCSSAITTLVTSSRASTSTSCITLIPPTSPTTPFIFRSHAIYDTYFNATPAVILAALRPHPSFSPSTRPTLIHTHPISTPASCNASLCFTHSSFT